MYSHLEPLIDKTDTDYPKISQHFGYKCQLFREIGQDHIMEVFKICDLDCYIDKLKIPPKYSKKRKTWNKLPIIKKVLDPPDFLTDDSMDGICLEDIR